MPLKFVVESLDEVDPALRPHYVAENGKFTLATQGDHPKVAEFRQKNVDLMKTVAKFEGVDPEAAKADRAKVTALEAQLATAPQRVTELEAQLATTQQKANRAVMRDTLRGKALAAGVLPNAVDILLDKALPVFEVENDIVKARPNAFSPTRPGELLTPDEWIAGATQEFPFLFAASTGTGADPGRGGGGNRGGKQVLQNPTPQQLGDPATAKAIADGTIRVEFTT